MKFEQYMHDSMQEIAQDVQPSPMMRARVMNKVQNQRTATRPRRMRFAVAAAAMMCVLVGGAFAAGPIVGLFSSSYIGDQVTSLAEEAKVEQDFGFDVRLPETLNGAAFSSMESLPIEARDADGNTVYTYQEFYASYADGETQPFMSVIESKEYTSNPLSDKTIVDTREVDGITLTYREIPTIFLPPTEDAKPTAEEQAAEERGEMFISYGSDTRIDGMYHTISWEQDGLHYSINANDGDWSADDFFAAAEDVLNTEP